MPRQPSRKPYHWHDSPEAKALRREKEPMHACFAILRQRQRGATPEEAFAAVSPHFDKTIDWERVYRQAFMGNRNGGSE